MLTIIGRYTYVRGSSCAVYILYFIFHISRATSRYVHGIFYAPHFVIYTRTSCMVHSIILYSESRIATFHFLYATSQISYSSSRIPLFVCNTSHHIRHSIFHIHITNRTCYFLYLRIPNLIIHVPQSITYSRM